jgi:two-component system nitrogen regulation sensor histidine kinase GlnL
MLAHEIKNPLSGIRGAAQLIESGADESIAGMTRLIRNEVDRITALIDRMEGFTDTRQFTPVAVNIHAVLGHAVDVARHGFASRVEFREVYDPSLPDVSGDHDVLVQILINLLKNAAEAMENTDKPVITLTTAYRIGLSLADRRDGQEQRRSLPIEVCVIDNGPGVPADLADHLFEPFVSSRSNRAGGLGLALVDKHIRDLGGVIEHVRDADKQQTIFRMLLPRVGPKQGKSS